MAARSAAPDAKAYDISFCVSLISLFDFAGAGVVTRDDWRRGTRSLKMAAMGEDDTLWDVLLNQFDPERSGVIRLEMVQDLVAIDPRMGMLLNAMVQTITSLHTEVEAAGKKAAHDVEVKRRRVIMNVTRRTIEPVLHAWAEETRTSRRQRHLANRLKSRLMHSKAFGALRELADEQRQMRAVTRRFVNGGVARAWRCWCENGDEQRRMQRFGRRMLNAGVARAFSQWLEVREEMLRLRRFGRRLLNGAVSRGFGRWCEVVDDARRLRKLAERVAHRLKYGLLGAVFEGWVGMVDEARATKDALRRRALNSMRMALVQHCFETWAALLDEKGAKDDKMRRFLAQLRQRAALLAFEAWRDLVAEARERLRRAAARFAHGTLAAVFEAWAAHTRRAKGEQDAQQAKVAQIVTRMRRRTEVLVLTEWRRVVAEARDALARAARRWHGAATAAALDRWAEFARERARFQQLGKKFVARYANQLLSKVFVAWATGVAADRAQQDEAARKAMAMLTGRDDMLVSRVFRAWVQQVGGVAAAREAQLRAAVLRMRNRLAAQCFAAWAQLLADKEAVGRAARRWVHAASGAALQTWREFAEGRRRFQQLGAKFVARYANQLLTKVFVAWATGVAAAKAGAREKASKAMAAMSGREDMLLARVLGAWRQVVVEARARLVEVASKALGRYLHQALAKCFLAWANHAAAEAAAKKAQQLAAMRSMAADIPEVLTRYAFVEWTNFVASARETREERVRHSLRRIAFGALHLCWTAWVSTLPSRAARASPFSADAAAAAETSDVPSLDLGPMVDSISGFGEMAAYMMAALRGLGDAMREARASGEVSGVAQTDEQRRKLEQVEASFGAQFDLAAQRLLQCEQQLQKFRAMAAKVNTAPTPPPGGGGGGGGGEGGEAQQRRVELQVPLAPLPSSALDGAAAAVLGAEVRQQGAELQTAREAIARLQREVADMQRAKAYRYELNLVKREMHRFLFGGGGGGGGFGGGYGGGYGGYAAHSAYDDAFPPPPPPPQQQQQQRPDSAARAGRVAAGRAWPDEGVPPRGASPASLPQIAVPSAVTGGTATAIQVVFSRREPGGSRPGSRPGSARARAARPPHAPLDAYAHASGGSLGEGGGACGGGEDAQGSVQYGAPAPPLRPASASRQSPRAAQGRLRRELDDGKPPPAARAVGTPDDDCAALALLPTTQAAQRHPLLPPGMTLYAPGGVAAKAPPPGVAAAAASGAQPPQLAWSQKSHFAQRPMRGA